MATLNFKTDKEAHDAGYVEINTFWSYVPGTVDKEKFTFTVQDGVLYYQSLRWDEEKIAYPEPQRLLASHSVYLSEGRNNAGGRGVFCQMFELEQLRLALRAGLIRARREQTYRISISVETL